ncbi:FAD/FMN-containing dehydrogenase/Fe-S oxidoreductase [Variovorax paradoxus]|uniref:FAD/FMN-containing dehydrogenase/Fe-S oxidoreductase n=1 Tax=Variovorax paradoxus TaxID=34073 RepID=A0AAE4C1F3_VARPD|nr:MULTISPECIES: FAD-binding and (Fe-S)-binding domain-containing protein [Variovorax]MBD9665889.1 FAD-binding protein [Variovorax sp. VRV01]MDP9968674.1 FAD/FMN-containing dehydrogenase/Fe-S oxidoreductase [Variovorax paradoxus]MDR6430144.1 FAD/FMN-containing dehydrogenase/Fe-S oxidoreductase [Variovorax paradoxus]
MRVDPASHIQPAGTVLPPNDTCELLARRLRAETEGEVLFDDGSRGRYATDASIYQITPVGAFVPTNERDIATAIDIARDLKVPVLARGGGTSQCGQTTGAALVIDNSKHFRRVLDVNVEEGTATVEPGLVLDHLNAQLKPHGLWYPVDVSTSAQATLGGMAGNNSCGSRSIAYGNMVHNVLGASAWLSSGELVEFGPQSTLGARAAGIAKFVHGLALAHREQIHAHWPKVLRRVAGYNLDIFDNQSERPYTADGSVNLAHLLIGAEGTLAYTRSLKLKLAPLPRAKVLGIVNFPTFHAAMDAAQHIVKLGPTAVELVDRTMIELSLANPAFKPTVETALIGKPAAILLVEFAGADKAALLPQLKQLVELMGDLGLPGSVVEMPDDARQKNLWEVRKAGLNIMMSLKGDGKPVSFIEDCAVPLEHLAEYTDALTEVFARYGSRGTWYAHASVGTLHVRPILDMRTDGGAKMRAIAEEAAALVRKYKGAFSGEHGDGLCRGEWIEWQFGPALNEAFRAIKQELDPAHLFNPGKIVDPPRMDDASLFRFAPPTAPRPYRRIELKPVLDWSAWNVNADPVTEQTTAPGTGGDSTGGLAKAVEMCNNNGHCRKFDAGTMCPSYRVTRDEQHLTRGRANTLRLALSGQLGADAFTSEEMHETMDLCVGCKGCKRDCPTGVDMAKMKIEFLDHYKKRHGHSLKDRLVARMPDYAHRASRVPWLMNLRNTVPGAAWLGEKLLGFSARRSLPQWRSDTFWRAKADLHGMFASREAVLSVQANGGRAAVLFVDTFNGTFESENALAAARVLKAAGYTLHTVEKSGGHHCCGRTFLASGMVGEAKRRAEALIDALRPLAEAGIAIVGLEPSCLLTLRDETLVMGFGKKAETVAKQALLFEEFIARELKAGRFKLALTPATAPILLHGHCHQKAFGAVSPILDVLRLIPGAEPELIESSCCGMAGSFGYEARHIDVSMQMAEASLLPAIRARPDAIVVADGTSCRHQIGDGAQREAVHVAVLLERHLVPPTLPPDQA